LSKINWNTGAKLELILVDNASTDNTAQYSALLWKELGNLFEMTVVTEPIPGKINAQETGLKTVKCSYALICDDDNALFENYVQKGYDLLKSNPKIGALGGQGIAVSEVALPDWFEEYSYFYACAPQAARTGDVQPERNVIYGAGMFINMNAWQKVKAAGFDYLLPSRIGKQLVTGAEDGEVCWAIRFAGYEVWYSEELKFYHHLPAGRLTEEYRLRLISALHVGSVVGKLYPRIFFGELTKPIKLFWLKELVYTILHIVKLPFLGIKNKMLDLKRSLFQAGYLMRERSKYDKKLEYLLALKTKLTNG
jgi:glycosyltransferase involved in cell wall biosynthesis